MEKDRGAGEFEILNAPSREVFFTRRERSNTPLQAFVTMNDPQFVEAARQLATQALAASRKFDARLDGITEPLIARRMTSAERTVMRALEEKAQASFKNDPKAAGEPGWPSANRNRTRAFHPPSWRPGRWWPAKS